MITVRIGKAWCRLWLLDTQIRIWVDSRSGVSSRLETRGEVVYWGNGLL